MWRFAAYAPHVNEDWRVRLALEGASSGKQKSFASSLADELGGALGEVRVTSSETQIFLYVDTADAAGQVAAAARDLLAQHLTAADVWLEHWDPAGQAWQDTAAVPWDDAAQRAAVAERDREWSAKTGLARWQVRVELAAHHEVVALAQHLASGGWPVARRRKYLVAGANTEEDAEALAQEVQAFAGAHAVVTIKKAMLGWGPMPDVSFPGY
jgi:hypothetical protein